MIFYILLLFTIIFSSNLLAQNSTVKDFSQAKRILNREFNNGHTIYCGCNYFGKTIDIDSCGYHPKNAKTKKGKENKRAYSLEWEHVVPAEAFGSSFRSWRNPEEFTECRKGKKVMTGRQCAQKVDKLFNFMEADLYNLHPEIGELNGLRSNYSMAEIPGEEREFGSCDVEIEDRKFEPRESVKGDVARIYLYMDESYPGRGIISEKNKKTL